jgi:hypothetical protein
MSVPSDVRVYLRDLDAAAVPYATVASDSFLAPPPVWSRDFLGTRADVFARHLQPDVA